MSAISQLLAAGGGSTPQSKVSSANASAPRVAPLNAKVQSSQSALQGLLNHTQSQTRSSAPAKATGHVSSLLQQEQNIAQGKKPDSGFHFSWNPLKDVGQAIHNIPGVEGVMTAIDTPAAYARSTLNQVANASSDALHGKGFDFNLGQLQNDAYNHVGIGEFLQRSIDKMAKSGDKLDPFEKFLTQNGTAQTWLKRGVGLAGDIGTDPLTYVSGGLSDAAGGLDKTLSTANRVELAKTAATRLTEGAPGITEDTVARLGRGGVSALSDAEKTALGVKPTLALKSGLFSHEAVAIPGTEHIAGGVRQVTDKLRQVLGDTTIGQAARNMGTPENELALTNQVVKGGAQGAQSAAALEALDAAKATARQFGAEHGKALNSILKGLSKDEMAQAPAVLEGGAASTPALDELKSFMSNIHAEANAKGANLGHIADYYPHALTPQAAEDMANAGITQRAVAGAKAPEMLRKYVPGEDFMGTKLKTGSVDEINAIAKNQLGHDIFDTSAKDVLPKYVSQVQAAVQRGSNAQRLIEHGIADTVKGADKSEISAGIYAPSWIHDAEKLKQHITPEGYKQFMNGYDQFTKVWKSGATMTPGFHIRNAYAHAFNNFIAGVPGEAYGAVHDLAKGAEAGTLSPEDAKAWDYVSKATHASGHAFDPAEIGQGIHKQILGAPGRASRALGGKVQDELRGAMALDSYRAGHTLNSAIDRIERFHFNYSDISNFDKAAKRVIPFWMWTSRNLPLQLQMMLKRPGAFAKWGHVARNLSLGVPQDSVVPGYFGEKGAVPTDLPLPGGEGTKYLAPDLGFLRAQDTLDLAQDPIRLLANANPLIKLPIESLAGKKLYNDVPFRPGMQPLPGVLNVPGIKQALEGLGLAQEGANGPMTTDKAMYTLESLFPQEGKARRLAPTEAEYQERWPTTLASYLGLGSLTNTPAAQAGELDSRNFALQDFIKKQQALGFLPLSKAQKKTAAAKKAGKSSVSTVKSKPYGNG